MTYYLNTETTGLDSNEKAVRMAEILREQGHDVEFTRNFGNINPGAGFDEPQPFEGGSGLAAWEAALIEADRVA